ncbi:MAG: ABC transporter ATP-binding protein [Janthinobacterium lividum]
MSPLLDVQGLHVAFGETEAVRGISFTVGARERVALVGESGSGKSVTALAILRLLSDATQRGAIRYAERDLASLSEREMQRLRGAEIAMIFQEPMTALNPLYTVGAQIIESITLHDGVPAAQARERALMLLERTGIGQAGRRIDSYPHQLSGGQRQRVMIAMALACRPRLLIADEPTTALDMTVRAQIVELLLELQREAPTERPLALLLISHDLNLVRRFAERVVVMEHGEVVESGPTQQIFEAPAHPYTQRLIASRPQRALLPVMPIAPVLLAAQGLRVEYRLKALRAARGRGPLGGLVSLLGFGARAAASDADAVADASAPVDAVSARPGHLLALNGVTLTLRQGETLGIVGESGSGKSTLAMTLLGLQHPSAGSIEYRGKPLAAMRGAALRNLRAGVQVVFQDPYSSLSPRYTIERIVGEGLALHHPDWDDARRRARIIAALREVGIDRTALHRYPHEFSGGQRQRIAIARALAVEPQIVVLDEPTSALDVSVQQQVLQLLTSLQQTHNLAYLFITHDLEVVRAMSHRLIVLRDGAIVEEGETEAVFDAPRHAYTQRLMQALQLAP